MASSTSRTMIAALQVSLDGFTQGPDEERWTGSIRGPMRESSWSLMLSALVREPGMYPGYGESLGIESTPILSVPRHWRTRAPSDE